MKNYLSIIAALMVLVHYATSLHKKCCDADSYLKISGATYTCDTDDDKRLQIFSKHVNYLNENITGEERCFDVADGNITEVKFRNRTVIEASRVDVNFFNKCCPLGHFYRTDTHSCVPKTNLDTSFITQNFIKVGLPQCNIIVDYKLNNSNSKYFDYRIELGSLFTPYTNVRFLDDRICMDRDETGHLVARICKSDLGDACNGVKCVHKCCPDGQSFVNGKSCLNTYKYGLDLSFSKRINNSQDPFAIIHKYDCRIYVLKDRIQYYLDNDGVFWAFSNKSNSIKSFGIDEKSYCIEHVFAPKRHLDGFQFFMCFPEDTIQPKFVAARWAKLLSCIFIILTIAVYLLLPEMMNLFGKILLSYCLAVLAVFVLLAYAQFETDRSDDACLITSFLSLFISLCSFTWLNVMCIDIWWTFGSPKSFFSAQQKRRELRRFLLYSLYGWGTPMVITLLTFLSYMIESVPYVIRPFLGSFKCFWENRPGNYGMFLYYVTPLILIEVANLFLFTKTIIYCLRVKGEINRMNDNRMSVKERRKSFNSDKDQLTLVLKLSITMGLSFVFEVVSSLYDFSLNPVTQYIEIVWDLINCLQGVFIFIIFVCKAKVLKLCRTKIFGDTARKISVSSMTTGQTTVPLTSKMKSGRV